jgi:hypothetical protein
VVGGRLNLWAALGALVATASACQLNRAPDAGGVSEGTGSSIGTQTDAVLGAGSRGLSPGIIITPQPSSEPVPEDCGNGRIDAAEVCDPGLQACCRPDCRGPIAAGEVCRDARGQCDLEETCDGRSPECPDDAVMSRGSECREARGPCDVPEQCDGVSEDCPDDGLLPSGTLCHPAEDDCDVAEYCTGDDPECPQDAVAPAQTVCRPAAPNMLCDAPELCDGESKACPPDVPAAAGTICGFPQGRCDSFAACDGESMMCPPLSAGIAPAGTPCRAAAPGGCDEVETCTGDSPECPDDRFLAAGTVCRSAVPGGCDIAETCTGSSAACPGDSFTAGGTVCRPAVPGGCDVAETCTGSSPACPDDAVVAGGTVCRAAAPGGCDVAETCNGTSPTCPDNAFLPASTVCRAAVPGGCDIAETCTGSSAACPDDRVAAGGTVCRPVAPGDACDVAESCDGASPACPTNAFRPAGYPCRAAVGVCDVAEACTGLAAACPPDLGAPATTLCRPANPNDLCDAPEYCPGGSGTTCPTADARLQDGDACNGGLGACWQDVCCPGVTENDGAGACELGPGENLMFVTSSNTTGAINTGNLSGLAAADTICTQLARSANLAGTYHAWLSGQRGPDAIDRVSTGPYFRVDGARVASNAADLTDSTLNQSISLTEWGERRSTGVWTGTTAQGAAHTASCSGFSSTTGIGLYGQSTSTDRTWTENAGTPQSCSASLALYCVQDDCPNRPVVDFATDPENCGSCGNRCSTAQRCSAGRCGG